MVKQFQWSENQVTPQQVPALDQEEKQQQLPITENQFIGIPVQRTGSEVTSKQSVNNPRDVVKSVGNVPNELYDRLGLSMPRWLLWILTVMVGIVLSGLMVSTLALWTPLWSNLDQVQDDDLEANTTKDQVKVPGVLANKIAQYKLSKPMNILVMGIEPVPGTVDGSPDSFTGESDTMLLIRLNPSDKSIRVLSIPRGTMIALPEQGLTQVSEANAKGGPVLAARVVSRTLGNAPIDRYIRLSTSGLRQLVDQLGGVDVFVPQPINYQNDGSVVNLVSGWQTLNGEQAENFARFREENVGDLGRVQRQQVLINSLLQRLNNPSVLPRLPQITRIMRKYFDTNLKMEEMMALANFSVNVERDNFQMSILPGTFSKFSKNPNSYWLNLTGQQSLLNDYVGVNIPGLVSDSRPVSRLRIAIQNASNQPHLTEKMIAYLKREGFQNIYTIPEWPDTQRQTQIIVQKGNPAPGHDLQKVLGLGQVDVSANGDLDSDLTIRIGEDWK
ncbi:MAG: LytR family transcriptional regulator [Nostocales cyanobacterium]|nr:MAG: LytR family transcriptional regulator [Nostocales cyanobacterium]TAF20016.1 MAG: LytR family transcriptional regulator [Nostocales cyanobacterium]